MSHREPLSNADYALVRFDSPQNWMIITALLTFETRLQIDVLTSVTQQFMLRQRRFRQRLVQPRFPGGKAYWEDDESFHLSHHLTPIQSRLPADPELLEELVSRVMSAGLDFSRPLWHFYLVEHYGEASALVMRFHHSLADGVSLVNVLAEMTDDRPVDPTPLVANSYTTLPDHPGMNKPGIIRSFGMLADIGLQILQDNEARIDAIRWGGTMASALGALLFSPPDSTNIFSGPVGEAKRAAWSPGIPLAQIKIIGETFDGTVNDVLLSAVAGALRRYIQHTGDETAPEAFHGLVPVDMRRDSRLAPLRSLIGDQISQSMGNQVGAALLDLPLDIEDPVQRLAVVHQSMDALKASGEALATNWFMSALGIVPAGIHDLAIRFWSTKSSGIMTNVVGPQHQRYLGNAAIDTIIGWVPNFGPAGLGVSFFSYNGLIRIGIATDQGLVPNPQHIVDHFIDELRLLGAHAVRKHAAD